MSSLSSLIARRYLSSTKKNRTISFMIRVCFIGIMTSTCALMLTLIIMNGFEKTVHEKMRGITAPVIISSPGNKLDEASLRSFIMARFPGVIRGISGSITRQVLLNTPHNQPLLFLKGVNPADESLTSSIALKTVLPLTHAQSAESLTDLLRDTKIMIGTKTALQYNLTVGDTVTLLIPEPSSKTKILLTKKKVMIGGIFTIGLDEYDTNCAYASISLVKSLFEESPGVDVITLSFHEEALQPSTLLGKLMHTFSSSPSGEALMVKKLQEALPELTIQSWYELYPALVSSLSLEKYVMFLILMLIVLIASMNMVSLLLMQIQQKRRDIAILQTLGMPFHDVRRIFIRLGMTITTLASLTGLLIAAGIGFFLERYPCIQLPDVYYVSYLPARMELHLFIIVFLCTLLLGLCATLIPARTMQTLKITEVLRHE
jgi:lipoprotein-releasing system permease protein